MTKPAKAATPAMVDIGIKFHTDARVIVPMRIMALMNYIHAKLNYTGAEFGAFLRSEIDLETMTVRVDPELYEIPDQTTTAASITFNEIRSDICFNTVCHRHPAGCTSFSGTDQKYINEDFDVSFIFIPPNQFPDAIVNIKLSNFSFIRLKAKVEIDHTENAELVEAYITKNAKLLASKFNTPGFKIDPADIFQEMYKEFESEGITADLLKSKIHFSNPAYPATTAQKYGGRS